MAQSPFLTDQIQIEPGSSGTRLIRRASDGSLEFVDAVIPAGLPLSKLAGLSTIQGVRTVGTGGAGAQYTKIQDALDTIPASSGPSEPYVVLIFPGVYAETVNIVRDEVHLIGLGGVLLQAEELAPNGPGAYHTVVVQTDLGTIPKHVSLTNITISNFHNTFACVRVTGGVSSQVGEKGVYLENCLLEATAAGGNRPLWADSVNRIFVSGGTQGGSHALAQCLVQDCAEVVFKGVFATAALQLDYSTAGVLPSVVGSTYSVLGCGQVGTASTLAEPVSSDLVGSGNLTISGCGQVANLFVYGNRATKVQGSTVGNITINDTARVNVIGSAHGVVIGPTGVLSETLQVGTVNFAALATKTVTFTVPQPDANYNVLLTPKALPTAQYYIASKNALGFTVTFGAPQSLDVDWAVTRSM